VRPHAQFLTIENQHLFRKPRKLDGHKYRHFLQIDFAPEFFLLSNSLSTTPFSDGMDLAGY
jgi:hypothetical protein